mgnify:CR=1 FL=1
MRRRVKGFILSVTLGATLLTLVEAWSQAPPPRKPHPSDPTAAEQWQSYAEGLKRDRDQLELDVAIQRATAEKAKKLIDALAQELAKLKAAATPAPEREKN